MTHRVVAFDLETYLISDRDKAPKPVCAALCMDGNSTLHLPDDPLLLRLFSDLNTHIVGHNLAYDLVVMMRWLPQSIPVIVQALNEGRVWDTQIRYQLRHLQDIGGEGYSQFISQSKLEQKFLGIDRSAEKKGDDIWRLRYGTLDGTPLEQWPQEARQYALDDARYCADLFYAFGGVGAALPTESLQVQAAVCLQLISTWGFWTDQDNVARLRADLEQKMQHTKQQMDACIDPDTGDPYLLIGKGSAKVIQKLVKQGWQTKNLQDLQALAAESNVTIMWDNIPWSEVPDQIDISLWVMRHATQHYAHMPQWCYNATAWNPPSFLDAIQKRIPILPKNKKGIKAGENDIAPIIEYAPVLKLMTEYKHLNKMLSTYIIPYENKETIHATYSVLVTTGRTASDNPNLQNIPRKGGFRNNLRARPGHLLGTVDYAALEMVTLAATLAYRNNGVLTDLGKAINEGKDLHSLTASRLFGKDYEQFLAAVAEEKKAAKDNPDADTPHMERRQGSKALNFGAAGGLGPTAFQPYAKHTYGVEWSFEQCKKYIREWKANWPDINAYLRANGDAVAPHPEAVAQAVNNLGRCKNNCIYTQLCNYPFQSLAVDGAKVALWELTKHQLLGWFWTEGDRSHRDVAAQLLGQSACSAQYQQYHGSPMRRSHVVNFVHDEVVQEHPADLAEQAFSLQQQIMRDAMATVTCGVKVEVEGQLGEQWAH